MILSFDGRHGVAGRQLAAGLTALAGSAEQVAALPARLGLDVSLAWQQAEGQARLAWQVREPLPAFELALLEERLRDADLGPDASAVTTLWRWWRNPRAALSLCELARSVVLGEELLTALDLAAVACSWQACGRPAFFVRGPLVLPPDDLLALKDWLPPLTTRAARSSQTDAAGAVAVHCLWQPREPAPWRYAQTVWAAGASPLALDLYGDA